MALPQLGCCRGAKGLRCSLTLAALMLALLVGTAHAAPKEGLITVVDLTGSKGGPWSLANANNSVAVSGVTLPAYVLQVLEDRKVVPDHLLRFNEKELEWVRDDTWTFTREFTLDAPFAGGELVLAGVDTVADVTLNGKALGHLSNEFRVHRLAVAAGDLVQGANKLAVTIQSAKKVAEAEARGYPYVVPSIAHVGTFAEHKGHVRKAGADFGWDWGPALGPHGIFGSIYLLAAAEPSKAPGSPSYMQFANIRQRFEGNTIHLTAHALVARPAGAAAAAPIEGALRFAIPELGIDVTKTFKGDDKSCKAATSGPAGGLECDVLLETSVSKDKVELWWPAGHGGQRMYASQVTWSPEGAPAQCSDAPVYNTDDPAAAAAAAPAAKSFGCSGAHRNIGFRTVELVTLPVAEAAKELAAGSPIQTDNSGESFYFRVNGVAMFLKGANLIPFDTIRTRVTDEYVRATLQGALDVHMNMLRVWGGGIYLPDSFYDECDRMGILLWQEAMFACAMYPADDAFLANVRQEVKEQVMRLGSHASLGVWGGNNENEVGFIWFAETRNDNAFYRKEYVKLYFDTVGDEITKLDPERAFVDSSPANGPFYTGASADGKMSASVAELLKVKRWGDAGNKDYGDVHFYENENDCTAPGVVPEARMMSEFGWQSDAPWFSIKKVTPPEDWDTWAPGAQFRQRWNADGTRIKTEQMAKVFGGLPQHNFKAPAALDKAALYSDWIYLRQVHQSICYDYTISLLRRKMRDPRRLSMGTLYWQLNDVWQGASWSSIDYELRWKPVHYALQRAYAPVQVTGYIPSEDAGRVNVEVSHDEAGPVPANIHVKLVLQPLSAPNGQCAKGVNVASFTVPEGARSGNVEWSMPIDQLLAKAPGCSRESCYLRVEAREAGGRKSAAKLRRGGNMLGVKDGEAQESSVWFAKFNKLALPQTVLRPHSFRQAGPREVEFTLTATGGAAVEAFWDAAPAGHFSKNSVTVRACEPLKVTFFATADVKAADLQKSLEIWTMNGALAGRQSGGRSALPAAAGFPEAAAAAEAAAHGRGRRGAHRALAWAEV